MMKMKTYNKTKSLLLLLVFLIAASLSNSCKKSQDIAEDGRLIINLDVIKTTFSVKFIDAKSGQIIGTDANKRINLTLIGPNKDNIVDILGTISPDYKYKAANGFFSCGLVNTINPTLSNPITFTILASLNGYISTSLPISVYAAKDYVYEVKMVKKDDLPEGVVSVIDNSGSATNGVIDSDISITTPLVPSTNTAASLLLPQGATLKDAAGNPLNGTLSVDIIYFNNMDDGSVSSYPGGLISEIEGLNELKMFFSAGLVSLEIRDASGKLAAIIENGTADLTIDIPASTYNTLASRPVNQGDDITLWSYSESNGNWKDEGVNSIIENGGVFSVTSKLNHFSIYRWSWLWNLMSKQGADLQFQSSSYPCNCVYVKTIIREKLSGNDLIIKEVYLYACMDNAISYWNVPIGLAVGVEVEMPCSSNFTSREPVYSFPDLSIGETREVWLDQNTPSTFVTADISAMCKDSPYIIIKPTMGGWYKKEGEECWRWVYMFSGISIICDVQVGSVYTVGYYFDEVWQQFDIRISEEEEYFEILLLTEDICNNLNY